ncbi:membrane lipoprotein lipid attachment site-containing protein [Escherichia coli]|uniref:membrane lipoprotein lipid attachment site-containing protein n=1 Tax=Escherichia coli TaxID=562 RepID=UPI000B7DF936|nr:membrane lipoprotein lipid attachment site-containing protein [Escherichia coli]
MKKFILLVSAVLILAACSDNGAGVSAGSDSSSGNKTSVGVDKKRTISAESSSETAVKMPAAALIGEAFATRFVQGSGFEQRKMDAQSNLYAPDSIEQDLKDLLKQMDSDPSIYGRMEREADAIFLDLLGKKDVKGMTELAKRRVYERRFISCNEPSNGWEVNPQSRNDQKILLGYLTAIVNQCDFTNLIFTEIASKLSGKVLEDPDNAREMIVKSWESMGIETIDSAWRQALKSNESAQFVSDLSGVKGVQFTGPNGRYANEGGGFYVTKNGILWYGNGSLSGRMIELSMRSTIAAKAEKSKSINSESSSSADAKSGSNVNVK